MTQYPVPIFSDICDLLKLTWVNFVEYFYFFEATSIRTLFGVVSSRFTIKLLPKFSAGERNS